MTGSEDHNTQNLMPKTLKAIAKETGGKYFESVNDKTLEDIYKNLSKEIKREKEETNIKEYFFLAALITFIIYLSYDMANKRIIQ
jgi:Ca-activated chloride channel family protein